MEQLFVRNQRFDKTIDMSRDPTMYPFTKKKYVIEFYYNPRSAPEHIQDKFGWNGEGMTDVTPSNMNTSIRPGTKCLFFSMEVDRDMLLRRGEWRGKSAVLSANYRETEEDYSAATTNAPDIPKQPGK